MAAVDGIIANVRVYNAALSESTLKEHYEGRFSDDSNLVGYWKLDEPYGGFVKDYSVQGNDGTQTDVTLQPKPIRDLDLPFRDDPIFYEPLTNMKLDKWVVESGSFEPVFISNWGTHNFTNDRIRAYGINCTSAGVIGIPVPELMFDLAKNRWEWSWKMYKGADANFTDVIIIATDIGILGSGGLYDFVFNSSEAFYFRRDGADLSWTSGSYITYSQWYDCKITRDASGSFSFYIDGALVDVSGGGGSNPITDTTYTTTRYIVLNLGAGDMVANLRVRRF